MEELIKKYPLAFRSKQGIIWDEIECSDGWAPIIEPALKYMHDFNLTKNEDEMIKVDQIKEKFGTLRFYTNVSNPELNALINKAEELSAVTCEKCGAEGKIRGRSWFYTACDAHTRPEDLKKS